MKYKRTALALALATLTAACGPKAETVGNQANDAAPVAAAMNDMTDNMSNMVMTPAAAAPVLAKGHGTVTAIDKAGGTITLDHGPIPEAKWPAMTMAFKAAPTITDAVAVGDKVDFDLKVVGSAGEVTAIHKQ